MPTSDTHTHKYTISMKQYLPACAGLLILAAALWAACTKPTPFGAGQLEEELAEYEFTDTLTLLCTIEREDSVLTSDPNSVAASFLCGEVTDPIFGKSTSEIYSLLQLDFLNPGFDPNTQTFDSIVLYMRYAPSNVYGDTMQSQTLRVFRLEDKLEDGKNYYSHTPLLAGAEIGRLENFQPKPNTADSLFSPTSKAPFISLRLNDAFGQEIFNMDTLNLQSDSAFYEALRGLQIAATPNGSPGAMLAFDLNNQTYSFVRLYYHTTGDTTSKNFNFYFAGANKFTHFTHDYNGSQAGQQIGQQPNDLLYLHGMQGLRLKIEIPFVDKLDNIAVNKAQLVLTTATLPNDNALFTPGRQLILTELLGDTAFAFTSDVSYSLGPALNQGFVLFGGVPEKENVNGTLVERYRLTMSKRLQDMVDGVGGDSNRKTVYVNISPQSRAPQRSITFGPKDANFPIKLELKYTRVR